jgi:hypothetical protein
LQVLFIGFIILALLGGFLSKCSQGPTGEWGGSFFNAIGFKSKEQIQKEQLDKLLRNYLQDQTAYLDDSKEDIDSITKMVEEASKKENVDLLRLKFLMKQFEDLNVLMIENGKELLAYNDSQKKKNKKRAQQVFEDTASSKGSQNALLDKQKDALQREQDVLNEIQRIGDSPSVKDNPELAHKLNHISNKSVSHLDHLKEEQNQIQNMNQNNARDASYMKERMEDLRNKNQASMMDNRSRLEDQTRAINDRIRDQMDRLKDKRP